MVSSDCWDLTRMSFGCEVPEYHGVLVKSSPQAHVFEHSFQLVVLFGGGSGTLGMDMGPSVSRLYLTPVHPILCFSNMPG